MKYGITVKFEQNKDSKILGLMDKSYWLVKSYFEKDSDFFSKIMLPETEINQDSLERTLGILERTKFPITTEMFTHRPDELHAPSKEKLNLLDQIISELSGILQTVRDLEGELERI